MPSRSRNRNNSARESIINAGVQTADEKISQIREQIQDLVSSSGNIELLKRTLNDLAENSRWLGGQWPIANHNEFLRMFGVTYKDDPYEYYKGGKPNSTDIGFDHTKLADLLKMSGLRKHGETPATVVVTNLLILAGAKINQKHWETKDKASNSKALDSKASDSKASDSEASDSKASDSKASDSKASDSKALNRPWSDEGVVKGLKLYITHEQPIELRKSEDSPQQSWSGRMDIGICGEPDTNNEIARVVVEVKRRGEAEPMDAKRQLHRYMTSVRAMREGPVFGFVSDGVSLHFYKLQADGLLLRAESCSLRADQKDVETDLLCLEKAVRVMESMLCEAAEATIRSSLQKREASDDAVNPKPGKRQKSMNLDGGRSDPEDEIPTSLSNDDAGDDAIVIRHSLDHVGPPVFRFTKDEMY